MSAHQDDVTDAQDAPDPAGHERTLAEWQRSWAEAPGDHHAAFSVVRALAALDRNAAILRWIETIDQTHPKIADAALRIATRAAPRALSIGLAYCRAAERRSDPQEAASRWWELRKRLPRKPAVHAGYIEFLIGAERFEDAERAAQSALRTLGERPQLTAAIARLAASRARATPPDTAAQPCIPALPPLEDMDPGQIADLRRRLMKFESLGRNCELGLLQRRFGAEPLGLLRFSTTRPATLLSLLRTQFAGIGDPAQNELKLVHNEYRLRHIPSGWRMHTGLHGDADPARVLHDQCRHTGFLRGKLLRDLKAGSKIFVYQMADIVELELNMIFRALQEYGPNLLMCVRLADRDNPPGTIEWPQQRLMVGYIDRQGQEFGGAGWDISVDYWLHFCAAAEAQHARLVDLPPLQPAGLVEE